MFTELLRAFIIVFIAELGDKSQFLAMTFATRYKARIVMLGIFIGILVNHSIAVMLGVYISTIIPLVYLQIISGVVFLFFAVVSLIPERKENLNNSKNNKNTIISIAFTFFIGELGDKTQITTMTLASQSLYPIITVAGTVSAMMVVACIGVFFVKKIKLNIPQTFIKILSSFIFFCFAITKLYLNLDIINVNEFIIASLLLIVIILMLFFTGKLIED